MALCLLFLTSVEGQVDTIEQAQVTQDARDEDPVVEARRILLEENPDRDVASLHAHLLINEGDFETLRVVFVSEKRGAILGVLSAVQVSRDPSLFSALPQLMSTTEDEEVAGRALDTAEFLVRIHRELLQESLGEVANPTRGEGERLALIQILGESGQLTAVPTLISLLEGVLQGESHRALVTLTAHDGSRQVADWTEFWSAHDHLTREQLLEMALYRERREGAEREAALVQEVIDLLIAHMAGDVDRMIEGLAHSYREVRLEAARRLFEIDDPKRASAAVAVLQQRLKGEVGVEAETQELDPEVRAFVVAAYGRLGRGDETLPAVLVQELQSPHPLVSRAAVAALSLQRDRQSLVLPLLSYLEGGDHEVAVTVTVLEAIAKNRPRGMLGRLLSFLAKEQPVEIRAAAVAALMADEQINECLELMGEVVVPEEAREVKYAVARAVGDRARDVEIPEDARAQMVTLLERLIKDPDASVRAEAASSLGDTGELLALQILTDRSLVEADESVLEKLVGAVGALGFIDGIPMIGRVSRKGSNGNHASLLDASRGAVARIGQDREPHDWLRMAELLSQVAAWDLAAWCYEEIDGRFGSAIEVRPLVDEARGRHAEVLWQAGSYAAARDELLVLHESEARFPPFMTRLELLARTHEQLSDFGEAARFDSERLDLTPPGQSGRVELLQDAVRTFRLAGRFEEALGFYEELLEGKDGPEADLHLLYDRATLFERLGRWDEAISHLQDLRDRVDAGDVQFLEDINTVITRIQSTEEEDTEKDSHEESPSLPSTTDGFVPVGESTAREWRSF